MVFSPILFFASQSHFAWHNLRQHLTWLGPDGIILFFALFAAPIFVVGYFKRREERDGPYRQHLAALVLASVLLVLSAGAALYAMGKHAGSIGEAIVPMFAAAWLVALASDYMRRRLLLLLLIAFGASFYVINDLTNSMSAGASSMDSAAEVMNAVKFDKHLVLSEDCSVPIEFGAVPEFVDMSTFFSIWASDAAGRRAIYERLSRGDYGAVLINSRDGCLLNPITYWDPDFIRLLKDGYKPLVDFKDDGRNQDFYLPRPGNSRPPR